MSARTIADPATLIGVAELQAALHAANAELVRLGAKAQSLEDILHSMTRHLAPVIGAFVRGDGGKVHDALAVFVDRHVVVAHPGAGAGRLQ
jgi:hypothetical protein